MAYQMAATVVTLNDFEGHSPVAAFSNAIRRTFVWHFLMSGQVFTCTK